MSHNPETYDDDAQLTVYLWRNYRNLLTTLESLTDSALRAEEKASHADEKMARMLRKHWGAQDNAEVAAALADGSDAFRNRVRDRIMAECRDEITLNRCAECSRLVMTPQAQQCLWCGYDWH